MADLLQEAVMLLQQAERFIAPERELVERRYREHMRKIAAKRRHPHKSPYELGKKYCKHCAKYKKCEGSRCPKCGYPMRSNKHAKKQ